MSPSWLSLPADHPKNWAPEVCSAGVYYLAWVDSTIGGLEQRPFRLMMELLHLQLQSKFRE